MTAILSAFSLVLSFEHAAQAVSKVELANAGLKIFAIQRVLPAAYRRPIALTFSNQVTLSQNRQSALFLSCSFAVRAASLSDMILAIL